jgi:serine/threonine protein kinase
MLENEECQTDSAVRQRYSGKVFSVLRVVAKALQHLHSRGIVHGNVCMENCGKYNDKWKLSDSLGMQRMDGRFEISRFDQSAPPECIEPASNTAMEHEASFRHGMVTEASIDSWAFGKLAYEVLTGEELVEFENDKNVNQNHQALMDIMHWSNFDQEKVLLQLKRVGISNVGIDLIVQCLAPRPEGRPNMDQILKHPVWKELKRQIASSGGQERRRGRPHNDNENENA